MLLDRIEKANDIKKIEAKDYPQLAQEIRQFLIEKISVTGGHLGPNLGTVELTMALHLAFNLPTDKIIWDVGHQSYTHKLLSGRKDGFDTLRQFGGMSGFPKRKESDFDVFDTGHSSTSISAGMGIALARDMKGQDFNVISVIGDGALTGGMAYEAMNNAGKMETNFIIVLNDNNMSISENVGGMSKYLNDIRTTDGYLGLKEGVYNALIGKPVGQKVISGIRKVKSSVKQLMIPGMLFEELGLTYLGPVDGHDIQAMVKAFEEAKRTDKAVLVHVITEKGKGYLPAQKHPARFHGTAPFDVETGVPLSKTKPSYTDIFSTVMCKLGQRNENVVAVTAAMPDGTGLKRFHNMYPDRFFDVGIAEPHAVTFAAGLASQGMLPVVAVYSSFLQRAYDQILHDVCLQNLPVVFAIDRAGLVGSDGETHQGIFDFTYLTGIPNMTVMAPKNLWELSDMMKFAVSLDAPAAVRYPRGEAYDGLEEHRSPMELGKGEWIVTEGELALLAIGSMVKEAVQVRELLAKKGIQARIFNARFAKPIDEEAVLLARKECRWIVTMEENVATGGYGEKVLDCLNRNGNQSGVLTIALPDTYVEHGNVELLKRELGVDPEGIVQRILEYIGYEGTVGCDTGE